MENITGNQSSGDTLTLMKRSKKIFKLEEKSNEDLFWNDVFIQPLGENRTNVKSEKYDLSPNIQKHFTDRNLTIKLLSNTEKDTVFDMPNNVGFYDKKHTKGLNSARKKGALYNLPQTMPIFQNSLLPAIEKIEES